MDNFKKLIKEALTPDFLKESVNEAKTKAQEQIVDALKIYFQIAFETGLESNGSYNDFEKEFWKKERQSIINKIASTKVNIAGKDISKLFRESVNEARGDKWGIYFQETNEYPTDTISRIASGPNVGVEWIRDSFETITDDFGFDKVDLANGIVDGLIEAGFANADLVQQALSMYLSEGKKKLGEDRFGDVEHMFSGEEGKNPVLVDVWYSHHEEYGTGGVYKVIVHFDDESEETFHSLKDAEAKYDLGGVEREETEFDVS